MQTKVFKIILLLIASTIVVSFCYYAITSCLVRRIDYLRLIATMEPDASPMELHDLRGTLSVRRSDEQVDIGIGLVLQPEECEICAYNTKEFHSIRLSLVHGKLVIMPITTAGGWRTKEEATRVVAADTKTAQAYIKRATASVLSSADLCLLSRAAYQDHKNALAGRRSLLTCRDGTSIWYADEFIAVAEFGDASRGIAPMLHVFSTNGPAAFVVFVDEVTSGSSANDAIDWILQNLVISDEPDPEIWEREVMHKLSGMPPCD